MYMLIDMIYDVLVKAYHTPPLGYRVSSQNFSHKLMFHVLVVPVSPMGYPYSGPHH